MFLPNMDCVTCCRPHMTFPHSGLSDVANPAVAVVVYIDELNAVFRLRKAKKYRGKIKYWHCPRVKFRMLSVRDWCHCLGRVVNHIFEMMIIIRN
jgi:hypothetical protein